MKELLEKYLMGQYIAPMTWNNCLTSRKDLVLLLKGWLQMTSADTIGNPNNGIGVTQLIKLQIGDKKFVLNNDTKRQAVEIFLENEKNGNTWYYSKKNRVSNDQDENHIKHLHMYRISK